jgi:hypothetical protein
VDETSGTGTGTTRATAPDGATAGSRSPWRAVAVVTAAVLLAAVAVWLAGVVSGGDEEADVAGREEAAATEAEPGQCLASLPGEGGTDLDVVPCEEQHLGEVVGVVELPDDTGPAGWPGEEQVQAAASRACADAFAAWVGVEPAQSELGLVALPPTEVAWRAGVDRAVVCIAEGPALVGSVRGTAA